MMNKKKMTKKAFFIRITLALALLGILLANSVSKADDGDYARWNGSAEHGMPSAAGHSETGLLPQIFNDIEFSGKADVDYPYEEWRIDISAGTVYCDDSGTMIRYGEKDTEIYYAEKGFSTPDEAREMVRKRLEKQAKGEAAKHTIDGKFISMGEPNYHYSRRYGRRRTASIRD